MLPLDEELVGAEDPCADLIVLDIALTRLGALDKRKSQVVELRAFAGLSVEEVGKVLNVSEGTVKRDWRLAKLGCSVNSTTGTTINMNTERWQQVEELSFEACRYEEKDERQIFLEHACGQDQELRREVESLIRHDESSADLIESRPLRVASRLLEEWGNGQNSTKELDLNHLARQIGSRYRIVEKLGSGGMGVVYKSGRHEAGPLRRSGFLTLWKDADPEIPILR